MPDNLQELIECSGKAEQPFVTVQPSQPSFFSGQYIICFKAFKLCTQNFRVKESYRYELQNAFVLIALSPV